MQQSDDSQSAPPLVVIGASAGGLEPLEAFFEVAPNRSGWSYVVVQHLSPDYRSMMDELLGRRTALRIVHIEDGQKLEPDTIYLNQPNMCAELVNDVFVSKAYKEAAPLPHLPVDAMFRSVAERSDGLSVAVVLSGSGRDGAMGAMALKAAGVPVLVQSPAEARFGSMPLAAINDGSVSLALAAAEMPGAIRQIFSDDGRVTAKSVDDDEAIDRIIRILEDKRNIDFTAYRRSNVQRQIERRKHLRGIPDLVRYSEQLNDDPDALDELYQDLLIGVTEFYRDQAAFAVLRSEVLDKLAADTENPDPIRIWVPACASGEEAYTIAMELIEAMEAAGSSRRFRIIATDVHRGSLERASNGVYSAEALAKLPPHHLERYFSRQGDAYVVDPELRQKMIFSSHDVLRDPPFMSLDLVSCRNLFIYLREEPQAQVLSMFLFGLRSEGYLMLGSSESVGRFTEEFHTVDTRWRLFRKATDRRLLDPARLHEVVRGTPKWQPVVLRARPRGADKTMIADIADIRNRDILIKSYNALLRRYAPSSILVTADGMVLGWFGAAAAFIDTLNNLAEWTVEEIVHPDLHFPINVGMEKLRRGELDIFMRALTVNLSEGHKQKCSVTIEALDQTSRTRIMLVTVTLDGEDGGGPPVAELAPLNDTDLSVLTTRVRELQRDLRLAEQTLQHVTERLEASGEELQASNEELQASNEELQASNEELQASNEELHAVNEELVSVSAEHERKIQLMSELNASTEFVLDLLHTGVIFVDRQGYIKRFSELLVREFRMEGRDVNRSIEVVGPRFGFVELGALVKEVSSKGTLREVVGEHGGRRVSVVAHPVQGNSALTFEGTLIIIRILGDSPEDSSSTD